MAERVIYRAKYDSPHFHFEAFGETPAEAQTGLEAALRAHQIQYRLDPEWVSDCVEEIREEAAWREETGATAWPAFKLGAPYRDGEEIPTQSA